MCTNLVDLPDELLIIIVKQLDFAAIYNLFHTCERTRRIVCMLRKVRKCHLSRTIMASAHILKSLCFKAMSPYIQELNLSAVGNLSKTVLVAAAKKLKSLHSIDLGYTSITICDFLDIYQHCPTIRDVTINFIFEKKNVTKSPTIPKKLLLRCQEMFKDFKSVHFIGSRTNLLVNGIAHFILKKSQDIRLQYTMLYESNMTYADVGYVGERIPYSSHYLHFSYTNVKSSIRIFMLNTHLLSYLVITCECIFICGIPPSTEICIYCSPLFLEFFEKNFGMNVKPVYLYGGTAALDALFLFWRKDKFEFDYNFFQKLVSSLKPYLPYIMDTPCTNPVPSNYVWYSTKCGPLENREQSTSSQESDRPVKKARVGTTNSILDYDIAFKDKERVELSICFHGLNLNPRTLSPTSNYLSKLTFLDLRGQLQCSRDFFKTLFTCCNQLVTFDCCISKLPYVKSMAASLPLTKSIKNLRIVSADLDFETLITSFSQCDVLENVHVVETSTDCKLLCDPLTMFQKCKYLYCFNVYANISDSKRSQQLRILNKAKLNSQKRHLSVNMINSQNFSMETNPFLEPFRLNLTKPFPM